MKKWFGILAVSFVVFSGCSAITFERKVENNTFTSMADPKVQIRINPQFRYIGQVSTSSHHQSVHGARGLLVSYNSYLFAEVGDDNVLRKGVIIRVDKISKSYWDTDMFADVKNKLVSDYEDINMDRYEHFMAVRSDIFTNDEMDYVIKEGMKNVKPVMRGDKLAYSGFVIPKCFMVEAFGIRAGAGNDTRLCVYYFEDLMDIDDSSSCREWIKGDITPDGQERSKKLFTESMKKAITFTKYKR